MIALMIWTGSDIKLNEFLSSMNSRVQSIFFTMENNINSIHFLDVLVYRKPIDKNAKLRADSYPPKKMFTSKPTS
jgi:hypothetical protein